MKLPEIIDNLFRLTAIILLCIIAFIYIKYMIGGTVVSEREMMDDEIREFLIISERFARMHTYNATTYNCINYSNDLHSIAKALGFETKIVRGCPPVESNKTDCHRFLKLTLDFEPIDASFRDYSSTYPEQKEVEK